MKYCAVVDGAFGCTCVSIRHTPTEAMQSTIVGRNPRIVPIPDSTSETSAAILAAIRKAELEGRAARI